MRFNQVHMENGEERLDLEFHPTDRETELMDDAMAGSDPEAYELLRERHILRFRPPTTPADVIGFMLEGAQKMKRAREGTGNGTNGRSRWAYRDTTDFELGPNSGGDNPLL